MSKLKDVLQGMNKSLVYEGNNYLYVQSETGEPHTIILQEDTLIVSGNQPGSVIHHFTDADSCLRFILTIAPLFLVWQAIIERPA